jgi:ATP-dependent DNA helicase RecG
MIVKNLTTILKQEEGQLFDFKSARIKPRDFANLLIAFANANGGTVIVGIEKDKTVSGIKKYHENVNRLLQSPLDYIEPPIKIKTKYIDFKNKEGKKDQILIIEVYPSNKVHNNKSKEVYSRTGDQNRRLGVNEVLQLAYDKGQTNFELEIAKGATLKDLDIPLIKSYLKKIGVRSKIEDVLIARELAKKENGKFLINYAGILAFGKKPDHWLPKYGIRFLRYEGKEALTGREMNLIKDRRIEGLPLPNLIDKTFGVVKSQLREFTRLGKDGKFETIHEYPEFAWQEAIVNAVAHRAYNITGSITFIKMFDDRFEVESPGGLPGTVTIETIRERQFSRNPRIARILAELKYIREVGEGINRMDKEMKKAGLAKPKIGEKHEAVFVVLKNNIEKIRAEQKELKKGIDLSKLNERQRKAIEYIKKHGKITNREYRKINKIGQVMAAKELNQLVSKKIIKKRGKGRSVYYALLI